MTILFALRIENSEAQCFQCDATTGIACTSRTQYIYCNATALDLTTVLTCPGTTQCSSDPALAALILPSTIPCFVTTLTGFTPTCNRPPIRMVTTFSATSFCSKQPSYGLYAHPTLNCSWFVRCYIYNSVTTGAVLQCPPAALFNPTLKFCDSSKTTC